MNAFAPVVALSGLLGAWQTGLAGLVDLYDHIPRDDVRVGWTQITDEATASHAFPEILYVVEGELRWSDDGEQVVGRAGTTVLIPKGAPHTLSSPTTATVAFFRWAPGGDLATLHRPSTMTELAVAPPVDTPEDRTLRRYESATTSTNRSTRTRTHIDDIEWTTNWTYSEELWKIYRYKPLVREALADWPGIGRADVRMGLQELEPGAAYPTHHHLSPEIYVVVSGEAHWTVGERRISAAPGTAIYTPPDTSHRIENTGTTRLRWLYFWWAPNGDVSVFESAGH